MDQILKSVAFKATHTGMTSKKDWDNQYVNEYKISIARNQKVITISFFQGLGIKEAPTLRSVLECLTQDWQTIENTTMEDFASDMGYEDIKKSNRIYNAVVKQSEKLEKIFSKKEIEILIEELNK